MKKVILSAFAFSILYSSSYAQISQGGIPMSFQAQQSFSYIPQHIYGTPDWAAAVAQEQKENAMGISKPYLVGLFTATDIGFPQSGSFTTAADGSIIWKAQIKIEDAPAIGLYFDQFNLPQGVQLYLMNSNKKQILGAYTDFNNLDGGFAVEPVQGELVEIELNIQPNVQMSDIDLHIHQALVYWRSISYLAAFENGQMAEEWIDGPPDPYGLEGNSSTCNINAICPQGADYAVQRKAAAQIIVPINAQGQAGVCSATMINSTGNTNGTCKQYLLTASHCEPTNSTNNSDIPLNNMLVRFNFERTTCTGGSAAQQNTINGVKYVARANYVQTSTPQINGDFLLLELKQAVPESWDVNLAGWDNTANTPTNYSLPKKFIGFHHPAGDIKKLMTAQNISPNGSAGGSDGPGTHWQLQTAVGGVEQGSSGSALFNGEGRVIGIASVAGLPDNSCSVNGKGQNTQFLKMAAYSKLSYDWDYSMDGNSDSRKLKPWLDPIQSGVTTMDAVKSNCTALDDPGTSNIRIVDEGLNRQIGIYPNPVTNGIVNVSFNLERSTSFIIEVYSIEGKIVKTFQLKDVKSNAYTFDMGDISNGVYLMKLNNGHQNVVKKFTVAR